MPTLLIQDGFRFFFWSNEGDPREPPHVHVEYGDAIAKYWLAPVGLVDSAGMRAADLRRARMLVEANATDFQEQWDAHFNS